MTVFESKEGNRVFDTEKEYKILLDDCCIEGVIEAGKFKRFYYLDDDEEEEWPEAVFENVTIGPHWGAWTAREKR